MKFNPIDLQKWPRGQIFYHFAHMAPTGYSLTVELDATALKRSGLFVADHAKFEQADRV